MTKPLPQHFCWSRFGTEAGEPIDAILRRKERERLLNSGTFLWGIGNALGPSMRELLRRQPSPEVVFSPIRSAPKAADVAPASVLRWTSGRDLDGRAIALPRWSVVTSRAPTSHRAARHYALVCYAETPIAMVPDPATLPLGSIENLLTGRSVGASQVTAIVRRRNQALAAGPTYPVAMRARLVAPFLVELSGPRLLDDPSNALPTGCHLEGGPSN